MTFINRLILRSTAKELIRSGRYLWVAVILMGNGSGWAQGFPGAEIDFGIAGETADREARFLEEEQERLDLKRRNLELQEELIDLQQRINEAREAEIGFDDSISRPLELPPGTSAGTTVGPAVTGTPLQSKIRTIDASRRAIKLITADIKDIDDISALVIYNQADFGKLKFYLLYETLRSSLVESYLVEFDALKPKPTSGSEDGPRTRALPLAAGAATVVSSSKTVLRSLVEILSFFRSQDTITFNDYNPGGRDGNVDFLVAQLVSNLNKSGREDVKVYSPSLYWVDLEDTSSRFGNQDNTLKKLLGNIDELRQLRKEAEKILDSYGIEPGYPEEFLPSSRLGERLGKLLSLNEKALELEDFLDGVTDEITAPSSGAEDNLLGEAEEEQNPLFLLELLEGAQIHEVLRNDGSYALILDVLASGGSQRIRQSLFTTIFTGSRLSYNGGIAIQYFLLNKDNSIKTADVVYYNTGFKGAGKIRKPKK